MIIRMQARQWSDRVIKKVTRRDWRVREGNITRTMQMIVTPRVQREVRKHFDCPDLEGAELEDQGEEGTALTHWEKRIFEVCEITISIRIHFCILRYKLGRFALHCTGFIFSK